MFCKSRNACACILFIPWNLVWLLLLSTLMLSISAVGIALIAVPFYLFSLFFLLRVMYLWCIKCKRTGKVKAGKYTGQEDKGIDEDEEAKEDQEAILRRSTIF